MGIDTKLYNADIGKRMKFLREHHGLSVEQAAELLGINNATIIRWEAGQRSPKAHNVKAAANCYGISAEWILTGICGGADCAEDKFFLLYSILPDDMQRRFASYFRLEFGDKREVVRCGDIGRQTSESA